MQNQSHSWEDQSPDVSPLSLPHCRLRTISLSLFATLGAQTQSSASSQILPPLKKISFCVHVANFFGGLERGSHERARNAKTQLQIEYLHPKVS
jgi:hypothetical protein